MSRHRLVRGLVDDDYCDDYDDYDDDDYDYDDTYTPPPKKTTAPPPAAKSTKTFAAKIAVPGKAAVTTSVGVTKPPPGWGKPTTETTSVGVTKPPPGFGKPSTTSTVSPSQPQKSQSPRGVVKPPPGWGKPHDFSTLSPVKSEVITGDTTATVVPPKEQRSSNSRGRSPKPYRGPAASAVLSTAPYKPRTIPNSVKNVKSQLSMVIL